MMNGFYLRTITTAHVCAVVIVLLGGVLSVMGLPVFAQENLQETVNEEVSTTATEDPVSPVSAPAQAGYTTEMLTSVTDEVVGDFVVGPGKTELSIAPGTSKTAEIMVSNRTGEEREFQLIIEDATGSSDPKSPVILLGDDEGPYTLRDYIQLPTTRFTLEHNERARIPVTVSVPLNAEPGGRYGSILVTTVSKKADISEANGAAPSSAIVSRVGTLFFLTIPGDTVIDGELHSFATVPDQQFFADGPINFQILFENKGALHLNPYGEIRITNLFNEEVGFVELDPWFALPKSLRSREVSWNRELLIGRYTATAFINRGYDDVIDEQSVTFWVLPWKLIVPIFIGLFLVFFIIRFMAKNFEFKRKSN
jgi:hypothetical protein